MTEPAQCPHMSLVALSENPGAWDRYREMRHTGPIVRSEDYGGYLAALSYSAVREVAADAARFCSRHGSTIPPFPNSVPAVPTEVDPPEHRGYRRILVPPLRPERAEEYADSIRSVANNCIDRFIERGSAELMSEFSRVLPPLILVQILGLPVEDGHMLADLSQQMADASAKEDADAGAAAGLELHRYVDDKITAARRGEGPPFIRDLANARIDGEIITHERAMGLLTALIVAGHETTVNGIGSMLWLIAANPSTKARLIADPTLLPAAVDEALRMESPVQMMARTVERDTEVEGVRLRAGDRLGLAFGAANHDERFFADPERFDIDRSPNPHVAFGHGVHRCVGEHLAKVEMRVAAEEILRRIPDYELAAPVSPGAKLVLGRGPRELYVRFTARSVAHV